MPAGWCAWEGYISACLTRINTSRAPTGGISRSASSRGDSGLTRRTAFMRTWNGQENREESERFLDCARNDKKQSVAAGSASLSLVMLSGAKRSRNISALSVWLRQFHEIFSGQLFHQAL